jgi:two-component system phosphate regulon sensor histidine kinase PhoR
MKKYCDLLAMQNEHLNNQVERILQTSQMEKRFFPLETKIIILDLLIEKVLDTFRIDPAIEFLFEKKETGMCVLADEIHFTNALYSIVDNARKYGLGKSPVTVKLEKTGKHIKVRVIDKGPGIEKKHIRHIYHKFYRVATGDIHNVKGFGLGLFYVKKVCDRHGWKINVNSVPGEGTEVEITMPEYVQER